MRCTNWERGHKMHRTGKFTHYPIRVRTWHGAYLVDAAEFILEHFPRKPIIVTARSIDNYYRYQHYLVTKRHLPHVDPDKPGIMGTSNAYRHPIRFILEGHHRAERHRLDRTPWACYVLTAMETWLISAPICDCWKGIQV